MIAAFVEERMSCNWQAEEYNVENDNVLCQKNTSTNIQNTKMHDAGDPMNWRILLNPKTEPGGGPPSATEGYIRRRAIRFPGKYIIIHALHTCHQAASWGPPKPMGNPCVSACPPKGPT